MKTYKFNSKDVATLLDHYIQEEKLNYNEAEQLIKEVIISNEIIRKSRQIAGQAYSFITGFLFAGSFISVLMAINAIENDTITLKTGAIWGIASLGVMAISAWMARRWAL